MESISALNNLGAMNNLGSMNSAGGMNQLSQMMQSSSLDGNRALEMAASEADSVEEVKKVFQEFVAGTFYSTMLKAMHAMHDKPAFMHGGQAEEMFQNQLDQQISKELAAEHGEALVTPLLPAFAREVNSRELAKATAGPGMLPRL
ncbi:MAG: rod-binding protein [Planctomycetaceae bacterium]